MILAAFTTHLEAIFWWIFDSTQFLCEMDAVETHLLEGDATRNPLTVVGESALAICIMWTHLCNASGETALPIRLISMEELDEAIFVAKVTGLSHKRMTCVGVYVCFTQGNARSFSWFFR